MLDLFHQIAAGSPLLVGLCIVAVLLLCGVGLPLPEDLVLIFTGYACYLGVMPVAVGVVIALAGVLAGDTMLWLLGRRRGARVMQLGLFRRLLPPGRLRAIQTKYHDHGNRLLFTARFMPGLRAGIFFFAGQAGVPWRTFLRSDGAAALLSVPALVVATYCLGGQIDRALAMIRGVEHLVAGGVVVASLAVVVIPEVRRQRERRAPAATPDPPPATSARD